MSDPMMSQYSELIFWLALINDSGLKLSRVKPIIQRWCVVEKRPLAELFDLSPLDWSTTFGLSTREAEQALAARKKLEQQAVLLKKWQAEGIETIVRIDSRYPKRLAYALPPVQQPLVLWVQGATELLQEPGVAMLGSQAPDEASARFIDDLTNELVAQGICLVSGFSRGLDRATLEIMLATPDGRAVAVLPMGLSAFAQTTSKLTNAVKSGQIALVSPFTPETQYQEKLADARNLLIDYLALALLIPHTDEAAQGRASEALSRGLPVFVGLTDTTTHRTLLDQGALLLTDTGEVVEMVQQAMIDAALQESEEEEYLPPPPAPTTPVAVDSDDNYSLHIEEIEPMDSQEALEILSLGGEIPEVLRQRLQESEDDD